MNPEENNNNDIKKEENQEQFKGKGFFKKLGFSILKIEKYPEMAAEGFSRALSYISKILLILVLVLSVWTIYQTYKMINEGTTYIENEFPDFLYSEGILSVDTQDVITIDNEQFGRIIVDTNTDSEETVNQHLGSIEEYGGGVLVLKDRVILKDVTIIGEISYDYKESLESMNLTEFSKQDVINYVRGNQIQSLYFSIFITLFIYNFMMYFLNTIWYALIISIVGYLATIILKMKMRYVAIFNMTIYALTLSTLLNILYIIINIFTNFTIQYFDIMYVTVATIYLLAAILIIKTELIKKQAEVMKIIEAEQIVKKELEEENKQKEEKEKRKKEDEEEDKKEKKQDKGNVNDEEAGESNA